MMKMGIGSTSGQIDPIVSAELVSRRWKEARLYYSLNRTDREVWVDAPWRRQAGRRRAMALHRSPRAPWIASADRLLQAVFDGAA